MAKDYYGILGVRTDATGEEIKRAYRKLARELHPDVNPDPQSQQKFRDVTAAYEVLSDPAKRQIVDLGGDPLAPGGGGAGGGAAGANFGMGFQDIMDAFFGGGSSRGPKPRTRPGADALLQMDLELDQAVFGCEKTMTVDTAVVCKTCHGAGAATGTHPVTCEACKGRGEVQTVQRSFLGQVMTSRPCSVCQGYGNVITHPCEECQGDGRVRVRETIDITVPAGVEDGMRLRLAGRGEVGPGGGHRGDLYVEINIRPHDIFTRAGADLHCRVSLPMTAAALGTMLTLKTLDSEESIDVKPGTQPGTVAKVRGKGVPHLSGTGRGDLHIHLEVRTPTKLSEEQEETLRQLAKLRGEERPEPIRGGTFFSRVRDAFNGH